MQGEGGGHLVRQPLPKNKNRYVAAALQWFCREVLAADFLLCVFLPGHTKKLDTLFGRLKNKWKSVAQVFTPAQLLPLDSARILRPEVVYDLRRFFAEERDLPYLPDILAVRRKDRPPRRPPHRLRCCRRRLDPRVAAARASLPPASTACRTAPVMAPASPRRSQLLRFLPHTRLTLAVLGWCLPLLPSASGMHTYGCQNARPSLSMCLSACFSPFSLLADRPQGSTTGSPITRGRRLLPPFRKSARRPRVPNRCRRCLHTQPRDPDVPCGAARCLFTSRWWCIRRLARL